jgi:hypothetical protein
VHSKPTRKVSLWASDVLTSIVAMTPKTADFHIFMIFVPLVFSLQQAFSSAKAPMKELAKAL